MEGKLTAALTLGTRTAPNCLYRSGKPESRMCNLDRIAWTRWVNVERSIMHSNSQLTDCFVSLALRRAAHDCITGDGFQWCCSAAVLSATGYTPRKPRKRHAKRII